MIRLMTQVTKEFQKTGKTVDKEITFGWVKGSFSISKELGMWVSFEPNPPSK